jgi:hypothetical protein
VEVRQVELSQRQHATPILPFPLKGGRNRERTRLRKRFLGKGGARAGDTLDDESSAAHPSKSHHERRRNTPHPVLLPGGAKDLQQALNRTTAAW